MKNSSPVEFVGIANIPNVSLQAYPVNVIRTLRNRWVEDILGEPGYVAMTNKEVSGHNPDEMVPTFQLDGKINRGRGSHHGRDLTEEELVMWESFDRIYTYFGA